MNDELSNKIIERIDTEKIVPLPRWRFILWRMVFWIFAALSVIVGSLAVGAILFLLADYRSSGLFAISHDAVEILLMVPYLWLIVFILFIFITRASIKHTKGGYRYSLGFIASASAILSLIIGCAFYLIGIGKITHEFLNEFPIYNSAVHDAREARELHESRLGHDY